MSARSLSMELGLRRRSVFPALVLAWKSVLAVSNLWTAPIDWRPPGLTSPQEEAPEAPARLNPNSMD